ncbi:hypothetical protein [Alkalihalobacillus trypoxylicola]|uniref:Uncharacterized protein n=1 Tax=Alkalihalobacillus trypoxylicola TaxID=519424 RepID=A0A162D1R3_9BACI|nr:hypothetical protein [Alkalihalobacillus trypoxylicola]KYG27748.1 hypothetical protein AZF04_11300 [Alkalihalobacillus trypoxylicola]
MTERMERIHIRDMTEEMQLIKRFAADLSSNIWQREASHPRQPSTERMERIHIRDMTEGEPLTKKDAANLQPKK